MCSERARRGFHVLGASEAILHTCTTSASAKDATTYGFQVGDTTTAVLDYCAADDGTYFNDALHLDNTALTCTTRWCTFRGYDNDVNVAGASATWRHLDCHFDPDNSTVPAGTHTALPTKRFNQEVIVAEQGGDFQALSEAVAWINAQADAAAGKLYGVLMLAGNFAEAGNVTIPSYVDVFGHGEGTEIEMGANVLSLSSHSSLQNVVVEGSGSECVNVNGATNVVLRDVRAITGDAAYCFRFRGASGVQAYHCIAETTHSGAFGFYVEDTAVSLLQDCDADDATNFNTALGIDDTSVCTVLGGRFVGNVNDVWQAAGATFNQVGARISPANVVLPGTVAFLPRIRDTVGCGLTHSVAQAVASGAWVPITFDTERWDDHQAMGGVGFHVPAAPTRITIPAGFDGRYTMFGHARFDTAAGGTQRASAIRLNGVTFIRVDTRCLAAASDDVSCETLYPLVAGDFVEFCVYQDSGAPLNIQAAGNYSPEFRVERK